MKSRWNLILCIILSGILLSACADSGSDGSTTGENAITTPETERDDGTNKESTTEPYVLSFEANTITGEPFSSEKFAQSKLTMINVWATYCNPCLTEMPDLSEIAASYDASEFQLVGIISDVTETSQEGISTANELIAETGADNYPHLLLNDSLYNNLLGAVSSVPTTFFVNQKGEALGYVVGANSKETWEEIINELLAEME